MRIVVILLLLATNVYPQSLFRISKAGRRGLKVQRTITTKQSHINLARRVVERRILTEQVRQNKTTLRVNHLQTHSLPSRVVGPNNYLKGVSRRFKGTKGWKEINNTTGYNGAHHIVTRFVIKEIGGNSEAIANAPSVFHPLHNDLRYTDWFHNHQRQLEIYQKGGIKAIILDFFNRVDGFEKEDVETILLEGELWSKHWGFKWE